MPVGNRPQLEEISARALEPVAIADPGNGGAIPVNRSGYVLIETTGAETRTLAIPTFIGQELMLNMKTDGGDCVVTVAAAMNAAGNTTITLDDVRDCIILRGRMGAAAALFWMPVVNDGCSLG
jgi:hypothetical protein